MIISFDKNGLTLSGQKIRSKISQKQTIELLELVLNKKNGISMPVVVNDFFKKNKIDLFSKLFISSKSGQFEFKIVES